MCTPTTHALERSHVFFGNQEIFQRVTSSSGWLQEYDVHRDHLGRIDRLTFAGGAVTTLDTTYSFDASGKRRLDNWAADPSDSEFTNGQWTERGYTRHEHLDKVKLIHMNGRVQDPIIGRMLSPRPAPREWSGGNREVDQQKSAKRRSDPEQQARRCNASPCFRGFRP
jgi:hypothetical protein